MQAQQTIALRRQSLSTLVAIVATLVAAALALALILSVYRPATSAAPTIVTLHGVGAEQIVHNRSEDGLGGTGSPDQRPFVVEHPPYSSPASSNACEWVGTPPRRPC